MIKLKVTHPLKPIYDQNSKILILGSFPSVKSREENFYYANKKNRFWSTLEKVFNEKIADNNNARKMFLLNHNIALFDVVKECNISASSDSSIKNVIPNNIEKLIKESNIKTIFTTGNTAFSLYNKYIYHQTNIKAIKLPSTSPANCKKGIEEILIKEYSKLKDYLN